MARNVVTGGAGFIGSHIAHALAARGDGVVVLDDLSTGHAENLAGSDGTLDLRELDLAQAPDLESHLEGVDTVFHQAAIPSVPRSVRDPVASHRANVEGTLALLVASRNAGVRRVVYASSSSVYGESPTLPKREDMQPAPISPYGGQKYFAELYMQIFWRTYGLETVSLRYFNVFGPRQDPTSQYSGVIAKFITSALRGERPVIYGDGLQSRDFTYVANVVDANLRASAAGSDANPPDAAAAAPATVAAAPATATPTAPNVAGEVFNIACGDRITVREMWDGIEKEVGTKLEPIYEAPRSGDIRHSQADVSRAREILGWHPVTSFSEGLAKTIDWYRSKQT